MISCNLLSIKPRNSLVHAATSFAQLAALALDNAQLHEALRQESIHDQLTGLFNRRFMQETLKKEVSKACRKSLLLAVVMVDLDNLKNINDTFGHNVGDEVLVKFSQLLNTRIRTDDIVCRYGGDEFILILPDASLDTVQLRMEGFRNEVKQITFHLDSRTISSITISVGIAQYPTHGVTEKELLKAADQALYQAKQAGRDQVRTAYQ